MQVKINGIDTRYVLSNEGGGPWLTFIHQLGGDLSIWDQLAGYFRDDFTVLRYDVRGHGATAIPEHPFSVADLSHDLATLLDALDVPQTHLVGMSMGGMIAQQFALDHPSRIDAYVGRHGSGTAPEHRAAWDQRAQRRAQRRHGLACTCNPWPLVDTGFPVGAPRSRRADSRSPAANVPEGYALACEALREFNVHTPSARFVYLHSRLLAATTRERHLLQRRPSQMQLKAHNTNCWMLHIWRRSNNLTVLLRCLKRFLKARV